MKIDELLREYKVVTIGSDPDYDDPNYGEFKGYLNPVKSQTRALLNNFRELRAQIVDGDIILGDAFEVLHQNLQSAIFQELAISPEARYNLNNPIQQVGLYITKPNVRATASEWNATGRQLGLVNKDFYVRMQSFRSIAYRKFLNDRNYNDSDKNALIEIAMVLKRTFGDLVEFKEEPLEIIDPTDWDTRNYDEDQ